MPSGSSKPGVALLNYADIEKILINTDPYKDSLLYLMAAMNCIAGASRSDPLEGYEELAKILADRIINECPKKQILFSSERLCDSTASLQGDSAHTRVDTQFGVHSLAAAANKVLRSSCKISLCLRHPISYMRSKYIRTKIHRKNLGIRDLSPHEYIQKQAYLENNNPGTSALAPAMHSEFIKQLQKRAFVKAFGFQELLASDDVFSLMGLYGEDKYAFRDFPRENKLPFTKEQEQTIEIEITQSLKQHGLYDRIMSSQMFE